MDNLELLYDHYKETFTIQINNLKSRNTFFVMLFLIMSIQFLFAIAPDSIATIIIAIVYNTYSIDISGQLVIIQCLLWLILLYLTTRYYQVSVYIERQYNYIHNLEREISNLTSLKFDRESVDYLSYYPKMCNMIDIIYKWVFPIIYCVVITIKITIESSNIKFGLWILIDIVIFLCCFILTILYLIFLHNKANK